MLSNAFNVFVRALVFLNLPLVLDTKVLGFILSFLELNGNLVAFLLCSL